jgi:transposase
MKNVSTKMLDHLGLVAGCFDELGIAEVVDDRLPKKRVHKLAHSIALKAMLLNGLGFVDRRLYLCTEFFDKVPCERLLGVSPEDLTDDVLGRTLDRIYEYGPTELFNEIVFGLMGKLGEFQLLHVDTTSFCVEGEYDGENIVKIDYGYSRKDGRSDLKRFVLGLVCNQHGMPVFMQSFSGNESDKKSLLEMITKLKSGLDSPDKVYHVADSAFFTSNNVKSIGLSMYWISRVPTSISRAKKLLGQDLDMVVCSDPRYSYHEVRVKYAGIPQKWVVVHSEEAEKAKAASFEKKLEKEMKADMTSLWHLSNHEYYCKEDALKAAGKWIAERPVLQFEHLRVITVRKSRNGKRGRPSKNEETNTFYKIDAATGINQEEIEHRKERPGRFILATNDLELDAELLLSNYKGQSRVEKGFRFLKDDTFSVSDIYLKNEKRIEALAMVMVLCLLLYSILEWRLRKKLKEENQTVTSQIGKPVQNPTMKWIFYKFLGITEIRIEEKRKTTT